MLLLCIVGSIATEIGNELNPAVFAAPDDDHSALVSCIVFAGELLAVATAAILTSANAVAAVRVKQSTQSTHE